MVNHVIIFDCQDGGVIGRWKAHASLNDILAAARTLHFAKNQEQCVSI